MNTVVSIYPVLIILVDYFVDKDASQINGYISCSCYSYMEKELTYTGRWGAKVYKE